MQHLAFRLGKFWEERKTWKNLKKTWKISQSWYDLCKLRKSAITGITQVVIGIQVYSLHKGPLDRFFPFIHPGLVMGSMMLLQKIGSWTWLVLCRTKLPNAGGFVCFDWYLKGERKREEIKNKEWKKGRGRRVLICHPFSLYSCKACW